MSHHHRRPWRVAGLCVLGGIVFALLGALPVRAESPQAQPGRITASPFARAGVASVKFMMSVGVAMPHVIMEFGHAGLPRPFSVASGSMVPTLVVGELFYADPGFYRTHPLQRGDVILFGDPKNGGTVYIKRVIGLPGDTVQMQQGKVVLNGQEVPRTDEGAFTLSSDIDPTPLQLRRYRLTLPSGRQFDVVKESDDGGFNQTPAYTVPSGQVFVLGDNLDNSEDSRDVTGMGMVPIGNVIGHADMIYWSPILNRIGQVIE